MLLITAAFALLLRTASAVFADEAYNIDYHYALLGEPQESTTFFHRPNPSSRASLIYTLSEQNVVGALNPKDGSVVWRHLLETPPASNATFLRTIDGADILISGIGSTVNAWSAADGKLAWDYQASGELQDVRVVEFGNSKDTLALVGGDNAAVVRLNEATGAVQWEHKIDSSDTPYQVLTSTTHVYLLLLHKTMLGYLKIKVVTLDPMTGQKGDEYTLSSESELATADTILTGGSNTAAPIVAWTDAAYTTLKINVLGSKNIASFNIGEKSVKRVVLHSPAHANSLAHFLVHFQAEDSNRADVFHIDVKSNKVEKAYSLPAQGVASTFSISSVDANVYFTRVSTDEILTVSSASHGVLGRWVYADLTKTTAISPAFASTELSVKGDSISAIRSAVWLSNGELTLLRDGATQWRRAEALADTVKAEFITTVAEKKALETVFDASNPVSAFVQRITVHLQQLINFVSSSTRQNPLNSLYRQFVSKDSSLDFGFHQTIICTTRKGRVFALDAGNSGTIEYSSLSPIESNEVPAIKNATLLYKQTDKNVEAYSTGEASQTPLWTFTPKANEHILSIAPRPEEDPVASIGVVLGNRDVLYKYLNPNLALITTASDAKRSITFHIIDTVSGSILFASTHQSVDLSMPVTASLSENWFAYSYTADSTDSTPKGHMLIGGELYESLSSNDRGILDASTNFSSLASAEKPFVLTQTYHIPEPISKMTVTRTRQGITTKQLLLVLPESNTIMGIPRGVLDPRRPHREPTKEEQMEGLVKYQPNLDFDPRWSLNHKREVLGIKDVVASPALLESTSLIFAFGLDIFGTRLSPSFNFDMLGKDFNKFQMLSTVAALFVATVVVGPLVMRKQVNTRWSLFT